MSALACRLSTSRVTNHHGRSTRLCITMAFSKGLSDRPDSGLLYRPQQSPREDAPYPTSTTTFPSPLSPLRNLGLAATTAEDRASLQRRFTTNALPTLSPIAQQRRQAADPAMTVSISLIFSVSKEEDLSIPSCRTVSTCVMLQKLCQVDLLLLVKLATAWSRNCLWSRNLC